MSQTPLQYFAIILESLFADSTTTTTYRFWRWNSALKLQWLQTIHSDGWRRCYNCSKFCSIKSLSGWVKWLPFLCVYFLAYDDVFHKRIRRKLPRTHGAQVQTNVCRGNIYEDLVDLLVVIRMLMLLGLVKLRVFAPSIKVCKERMKNHWTLINNSLR